MDYGIVQQGEGMGAAPPARGVGGIAAVGSPAVAPVLAQTVELADVFGVAHALENAHVFATGEHIRPGDLRIEAHNGAHHELLFIHLHGPQGGAQGGGEVPPDQRLIGDLRHFFHGDLLRQDDVEALFQKRLTGPAGTVILEKEMKGEIVPVFRVDAIAGKAAAQTVGAVVHGLHTVNDGLAAHAPALPGDDGGDGAAGGDTHLSFQ